MSNGVLGSYGPPKQKSELSMSSEIQPLLFNGTARLTDLCYVFIMARGETSLRMALWLDLQSTGLRFRSFSQSVALQRTLPSALVVYLVGRKVLFCSANPLLL